MISKLSKQQLRSIEKKVEKKMKRRNRKKPKTQKLNTPKRTVKSKPINTKVDIVTPFVRSKQKGKSKGMVHDLLKPITITANDYLTSIVVPEEGFEAGQLIAEFSLSPSSPDMKNSVMTTFGTDYTYYKGTGKCMKVDYVHTCPTTQSGQIAMVVRYDDSDDPVDGSKGPDAVRKIMQRSNVELTTVYEDRFIDIKWPDLPRQYIRPTVGSSGVIIIGIYCTAPISTSGRGVVPLGTVSLTWQLTFYDRIESSVHEDKVVTFEATRKVPNSGVPTLHLDQLDDVTTDTDPDIPQSNRPQDPDIENLETLLRDFISMNHPLTEHVRNILYDRKRKLQLEYLKWKADPKAYKGVFGNIFRTIAGFFPFGNAVVSVVDGIGRLFKGFKNKGKDKIITAAAGHTKAFLSDLSRDETESEILTKTERAGAGKVDVTAPTASADYQYQTGAIHGTPGISIRPENSIAASVSTEALTAPFQVTSPSAGSSLAAQNFTIVNDNAVGNYIGYGHGGVNALKKIHVPTGEIFAMTPWSKPNFPAADSLFQTYQDTPTGQFFSGVEIDGPFSGTSKMTYRFGESRAPRDLVPGSPLHPHYHVEEVDPVLALAWSYGLLSIDSTYRNFDKYWNMMDDHTKTVYYCNSSKFYPKQKFMPKEKLHKIMLDNFVKMTLVIPSPILPTTHKSKYPP